MIVNGHLYELGHLPHTDLSSLQASFETLPNDPYADDRLRSRCYSRFTFDGIGVELLEQQDFMQSSEINKAVGDVDRSYKDIPGTIYNDDVFLSMFDEFTGRTGLNADDVIEAHQIRWHCRRRIKAPAPEGRHQDGFDFIAIYLLNQHNVDGGEMMLYQGPDAAPCFKKQLDPGEFVVLNDKKLFHNASPLVPTANDDDGYWDVFVLTANKSG